MEMKPLGILVSGPSGAGKTTLLERLLNARPEQFAKVVTCTTRKPRPRSKDGPMEENGVDYWFFEEAEFQRKVASGELLEEANVHGNYYGTPKSELDYRSHIGKDVLLAIDVQGYRNVRWATKHAEGLRPIVSIFISTPTVDVLVKRLSGRGSDDSTAIEQRIKNASAECHHWPQYDYVIESTSPEADLEAALCIIDAEHRRSKHVEGQLFGVKAHRGLH
jgi:guanylate kinase